MTWCVARGDLACCVSYLGLISLLLLRPISSTQQLSWSSSSMWRGWHARATTWLHTRAVEIRHSPFVMPTTRGSELFPSLVKMPCCTGDCQRCAAHLGGFKFPWLGLWSSRGVIIPPDVQPGDAWDFYYKHQASGEAGPPPPPCGLQQPDHCH